MGEERGGGGRTQTSSHTPCPQHGKEEEMQTLQSWASPSRGQAAAGELSKKLDSQALRLVGNPGPRPPACCPLVCGRRHQAEPEQRGQAQGRGTLSGPLLLPPACTTTTLRVSVSFSPSHTWETEAQ